MSLVPALPATGAGPEALKALAAGSHATPASPAGGLSLQETQAPTAPAEAALGAGETSAPAATETPSFGNALTEALSSLEGTQQSAATASQSLALGTVKDPEQAVMTVEDAQMAMDLAAQVRTKATEAVQTIFQTQV